MWMVSPSASLGNVNRKKIQMYETYTDVAFSISINKLIMEVDNEYFSGNIELTHR